MLEYALLTCLVAIVAFIPYVKWTGKSSFATDYTKQCKEAIRFLALPCP